MQSLRTQGRIDGTERQTVSVPVREPGSRPDERPCDLAPEATLLDHDGVALTGIEGFRVLDDGRLLLGHVDDPSALLRYYFGRGSRQVILSGLTGVVEGRLDTSWAGNGRHWWLELNEAARPVAPPTAGEDRSDAAHGQRFGAGYMEWLLDDLTASKANNDRPVSTVR